MFPPKKALELKDEMGSGSAWLSEVNKNAKVKTVAVLVIAGEGKLAY